MMLMEVHFNVTYITLDGFIQMHRYRYLYFVILFIIYILILCFNSTIVFLIVFQRSLHEPMYIFIAALLLNSIMFSTVVYPKLFIDLLSERQIISYSACSFQNFIFYTLGVSEFLQLAVMAYDRYVSICKPLQYPVIMRKKTVTILIVSAWFVSAFHLSVYKLVALNLNKKLCSLTLKGIFCSRPLHNLFCETSKVQIILTMVMLFDIAVLPVLLICFSYTRIIIISCRSGKEVRRKAAQTCLPHLLVLISFSCITSFDVGVIAVDAELSKTTNLMMTLQTVTYQPLFNPIIYGLRMKEIFKHLKTLLCRVKMDHCFNTAN